MSYIEEKCQELSRYMKTNDLIRMMANATEEWTQEDCDRAVRETGSLRFCVADVHFIRALDLDASYQEAMTKVDASLKKMTEMPPAERQAFWESTAKSLMDSAKSIRSSIRKTLPVQFYSNDYPIGGNQTT